MIWDLWYFEDLEEKDYLLHQSVNQLVSDGGVCRTALSTPGLLNILFDLVHRGDGGLKSYENIVPIFP